MKNVLALKYKDKRGNDVVVDLSDKQFCFYFPEHARKFIAEMEPSDDPDRVRKFAEFPEETEITEEQMREWVKYL